MQVWVISILDFQVVFYSNVLERLTDCLPAEIWDQSRSCLSFKTMQIFCFDSWNLIKLFIVQSSFMNHITSEAHLFWEGHKILRNLHQLFDWQYIWQIIGGDFAKFCGLLRIYELLQNVLKLRYLYWPDRNQNHYFFLHKFAALLSIW